MARELKARGTFVIATLSIGLLMIACGGGEVATPTPPPTVRPAPTVAPARATPVPTATLAPTPVVRPPASGGSPTPQATATAAPSARKLTAAVSTFDTEAIIPSSGGRLSGMQTFGAPIYDSLIWGSTAGGIAPGIATKWEVAPDGKSWTLTLRTGMQWHNGDRLTAEDVKFSLESFLRPQAVSGYIATLRASLQSVDVLSPAAVRVNLKIPWTVMPYDLAIAGGELGIVVPKSYMERVGEREFELKPVGSGPWKLVRRDIGVRFVYEPSEIKHPYRETPKFRPLELLAVPEETTRTAMLKTEVADIIEIGAFDAAIQLSRQRGIRIVKIDNLNIGRVQFGGILDPRIKGMPLEKRDVRLALELAVNKQEIADTILGGFATVAARTAVTPGTVGWLDSMKPRPYDPAQAKRLLAEAGYPNGFDITVYNASAPSVAWLVPMTEAVVGYWTQVGIRPKVLLVDRTIASGYFRVRPQAPEWVGSVSPLYTRPSLTNQVVLRTLYHSKGTVLLYGSPEMDALLDKAAASIDPKEMEGFITRAQNLAWDVVAEFAVALAPGLYAAGPRVGSVAVFPLVDLFATLETASPAN